jgi:hypothetical protein
MPGVYPIRRQPRARTPCRRRLLVANWVMNRHEDPYQGARRQRELPNYWFGVVPETWEKGTVVTCAYWIVEHGGR